MAYQSDSSGRLFDEEYVSYKSYSNRQSQKVCVGIVLVATKLLNNY